MDRTLEDPRRRSDGAETHAEILDVAMDLASVEGLSGLTIGRLARELGLSKSGVYAHFGSKERLQRETIAAASEVFDREVLEPAGDAPEGIARVEALCEAYLSYVERGVFPGGCFFAQVLAEFDAHAGPVHDEVEEGLRGWQTLLAGQVEVAQDRGDLDPSADPAQVAFELYAPLELANYLSVMHRDPAIVDRGRRAIRAVMGRLTTGAEADQR